MLSKKARSSVVEEQQPALADDCFTEETTLTVPNITESTGSASGKSRSANIVRKVPNPLSLITMQELQGIIPQIPHSTHLH